MNDDKPIPGTRVVDVDVAKEELRAAGLRATDSVRLATAAMHKFGATTAQLMGKLLPSTARSLIERGFAPPPQLKNSLKNKKRELKKKHGARQFKKMDRIARQFIKEHK